MSKKIATNNGTTPFSNFNYSVVESSLAGFKEVRVSLNYDGRTVNRFIFVKKKPNEGDSYYINEAKQKISEEIQTGKLRKESKRYINPKKPAGGKIALAIVSVVAVAAAGLLTYKLLETPYSNTINNCTVTFDANGGSAVDAVVVKKGETVEEPKKDPHQDGYIFNGWYIVDDPKPTDETFDFDNTPIEKNITLHAGWTTRNNIVIKFYANGGSFGEGEEYYRLPGQKFGEYPDEGIPTPIRAEDPFSHIKYTFDGWYDENGNSIHRIEKCEYNSDERIYLGETYTARWTQNEFADVNFDFNDHGRTPEPTPSQVVRVYDGDYLVAPHVEDWGHHTFLGWFDNYKRQYDFSKKYDVDDGPRNLTAMWDVEKHKVSFNLDGGTGNGDYSTQTVDYGEKATDPKDLVFEGENPTKPGYEFAGWKIYGTTTIFDFRSDVVTEDLSLIANWDDSRTAHYVDFWNNDGTEVKSRKTVRKGEYLTPVADPTRVDTHYTFVGWSTDPNSYVKYDFSQPYSLNDDLDLYAYWEADTYKVSFDLKGGTPVEGVDYSSQLVKYNEYATEPEETVEDIPTKHGYTFAGWYDDSEAVAIEPFDFENTPITGNLTLTAHWTENDSYTIDFYLNPTAEEPMTGASQTIYSGDYIIPLATPMREGYNFVGWFETGSNTPYDFSKPYTAEADLNLYGHWTCTLTYNFNDGSTAQPYIETYVEGTKPTKPSWIPSYEGYIFTGWYTDPTSGTEFDFNAALTANTQIYAHWEVADSYYITYINNIDSGSDGIFTVNIGPGRATTITADPDKKTLIAYKDNTTLDLIYYPGEGEPTPIYYSDCALLVDGESVTASSSTWNASWSDNVLLFHIYKDILATGSTYTITVNTPTP